MKNLLTAIIVLIGFSSCSNYYKAIVSQQPTKASSFNDFQDSKKYYILHNGTEVFSMKNISMSSDKMNVLCTLEAVPIEHTHYINRGKYDKMKYKTKTSSDEDESGVLNEVHIYLVPGNKTEMGAYTLALENVLKAEIIEKDKIKTKKSHVTGTIIGVSVAVVGIAAIAVLALSASLASGF